MTRSAIDHAGGLGTAPLGRLLWRNCAQTTASVGVYGIYALTNAWFVARGVGEKGLAAVNLVAPVLLILGAVSTAVGVGGASLVSRALGAGDRARAARAAGGAFAVFWTVAATITVVGIVGINPLLTLLGAQPDTREMARQYAVILLAGAVASTGFSAIVRAEGRMGYSTAMWLVPVGIQAVCDPLLILGCHLGVRGAGFGTLAGQVVSTAMSVWFFFVQRRRPYRIRRRDLWPDLRTVREVLGIGAPSFLTGFGTTVLTALVNATLSGLGGVSALAAFAVCSRIQTFVVMPQTGITQGLQPVAGYNAGRRQVERVRRARVLTLRATVVYGALAAGLVVALADPLVGAFVTDPRAVATAGEALRIIAIGFVFSGVAPLVSGYFQAIGRATPSYVISIGTLLVLKIPLVIVLAHAGLSGVWLALPVGEVLSAIAAYAILRAWSRTGTGTTAGPTRAG